MTYKDIAELIKKIADTIGCDYHYYTEEEAGVVKTPYLLFDYPQSNDMYADDANFQRIQTVRIEYDSKQKAFRAEKDIEALLKDAELSYTKESTMYEGQSAYGVMYEMEVVINE